MATPTSLPASFSSGAVLTAAQMNNLRGAFRVLQIIQTTKTDTFSTTSTSFTDVTGLSVSITPSATSSKILVIGYFNTSGNPDGTGVNIRLMRGSTEIFVGDAASTRTRATGGGWQWRTINAVCAPTFLDSPATTSSTTYKLQMSVGANTGYLNRTGLDVDNPTDPSNTRVPSSITVMEISA